MYRRRSNAGNPILRLIIIGIVVGMGYFILDQVRNAPPPLAEPIPEPARTREIPTFTPIPASYIATLTAIPRNPDCYTPADSRGRSSIGSQRCPACADPGDHH